MFISTVDANGFKLTGACVPNSYMSLIKVWIAETASLEVTLEVSPF